MPSRMRSPLRWISVENCFRSASDSRCRTSAIFARISSFAFWRLAGRMKNPSAATTEARTIPVTSAAAVVAANVTMAPRPSAVAPAAAAAATALRALSASCCASRLLVVRVDDPLRLAADGVDQARAVVVKLAGVFADDPVLVLPPALGEMRGDRLPLPQVRGHQPVDQLPDLPLDLLRRVGDDLLLEPLLDRGCGSADPSRGRCGSSRRSSPARAAPSRAGSCRCRPCGTRSRASGPPGRPPAAARPLRASRSRPSAAPSRSRTIVRMPLGERGADAERVQQLEVDAAGRVERRRDVALERLEAARRPG